MQEVYGWLLGYWLVRLLMFQATIFDWLTVEILDTLLPERVHRCNPRVLKKPVSKFRSKKLEHRGIKQQFEALTFHILTTAFSLN